MRERKQRMFLVCRWMWGRLGSRTSVCVLAGMGEGPFSPPRVLQALLGELGPVPGALLLEVESGAQAKIIA